MCPTAAIKRYTGNVSKLIHGRLPSVEEVLRCRDVLIAPIKKLRMETILLLPHLCLQTNRIMRKTAVCARLTYLRAEGKSRIGMLSRGSRQKSRLYGNTVFRNLHYEVDTSCTESHINQSKIIQNAATDFVLPKNVTTEGVLYAKIFV